MTILIVDDSPDNQALLQNVLESDGYSDLIVSESAFDALRHLGVNNHENPNVVDLILMDIVMPDMDGIEACRLIKTSEYHNDVPIIMVTAMDETKHLQRAFAAGALDYVTKPLKKYELLARVRSALKLKHELDYQKKLVDDLLKDKKALEEKNNILYRLSYIDSQTGIANRRCFDDFMNKAWKLAHRNQSPLSLLFIDIDFFKEYNEIYGHVVGDECLRLVAKTLSNHLYCEGNLIAHYTGDQFAVVLPETGSETAQLIAEKIRMNIEGLGIPHPGSSIGSCITASLGFTTTVPSLHISSTVFLSQSDQSLKLAKIAGGNNINCSTVNLAGD